MRTVLLTHACRYPKMLPRDAVKLLYQSEFGGGHLISDPDACLRRLREECAATPASPDQPLWEDIGSRILRIHLAALPGSGYTPEDLGRDFIRSAGMHRGSMDAFREKLTLLEELTAAGQMPFSPEALSQYLPEYRAAGFPPVSHSEAYRNAYHPAYRVVRRDCLPDALFTQVL